MNRSTQGLLGTLAITASLAAIGQSNGKPPIVIGQTYIQTGPLATLSTEPLTGIRAMLAATNAKGGINGRLLELRLADDAADTETAAANVRTVTAEISDFMTRSACRCR